MKVLVIDNYDSFVYNLVQYIGELGAETVVYRNDKITLLQAAEIKPDRIVISPGPGNPEDDKFFGVCKVNTANLEPNHSNLGSLPWAPGNNPHIRRQSRSRQKTYAWKNLHHKTQPKSNLQGSPQPFDRYSVPFTCW